MPKKKQMRHYLPFTKEMKKTHTILMPDMLPIHFELISNILNDHGYKTAVLKNRGSQIARLGLKYVHNDTCYPALLVIGQMIDALQSGEYDPDTTAFTITQTGGGCRASNYIHLMRKALKKAGFGQVPVLSISANGMESHPGMTYSLGMLRKVFAALWYGDELMLLYHQVKPYERCEGETDRVLSGWIRELSEYFSNGDGYTKNRMKTIMRNIAVSFEAIEIIDKPKIKVGIVGEIYVKYSELGNNDLVEFLHSQGCEVMIPGVMGFMLYGIYNGIHDHGLYGGNNTVYLLNKAAMWYLSGFEKLMTDAVARTRFVPVGHFKHTISKADGVVGHGCKMGEGWLLTAEMLELCELGYSNIICTQPFGCLPNHVNGRGMMNKIKETAPNANIVAIDYDPGMSRVNQENRIKLMLASAEKPAGHSAAVSEKHSALPRELVSIAVGAIDSALAPQPEQVSAK